MLIAKNDQAVPKVLKLKEIYMNTLVKFLFFTFLFGNNHPWHTSLNILIPFSRDTLLSGVNETIL